MASCYLQDWKRGCWGCRQLQVDVLLCSMQSNPTLPSMFQLARTCIHDCIHDCRLLRLQQQKGLRSRHGAGCVLLLGPWHAAGRAMTWCDGGGVNDVHSVAKVQCVWRGGGWSRPGAAVLAAVACEPLLLCFESACCADRYRAMRGNMSYAVCHCIWGNIVHVPATPLLQQLCWRCAYWHPAHLES